MGHRRRAGRLATCLPRGRPRVAPCAGRSRPTSPALPGRPVRVIVTSDARLPDDPGPWTIVRIAAGDDPDRLRDLARAADFTVLIAPETSGILASLTRDFEQAGARLLGSTADAVELAADKARLAARLRELSIDTPPTRTIVPGAGLPHDAQLSGRPQADRRRRFGRYVLPGRRPEPAGRCAGDAGRLAPAVRSGNADERQFSRRPGGPELADRRGNPADGDPRGPV